MLAEGFSFREVSIFCLDVAETETAGADVAADGGADLHRGRSSFIKTK